VDCSGAFSNYGCNGGFIESSFDYIETSSLMLEEDYPYNGEDGFCQYYYYKGVGIMDRHYNVPPNSVD